MKILYAASKRKNAADQLNRFLRAVEPLNHTIKVAAYRNTPCIKFVDWNLDALLNIFNPDKIYFENDNLSIYYEQVKYFNPDLIISDLEIFTSHIATILNIPIFQVGPRLLYEGLGDKYNIGVNKKYSYIFTQEHVQMTKNMIDNATCNFTYSHLCDLANPPPLKNNFEYVRPYHVLGKHSPACYHELVGITSNNDRKMIQLLKTSSDAVLFTNFIHESYPGIILKNSGYFNEYACNLQNCTYFINQGSAEHLADAFYNNKFSWIMPDFTDHESIINSVIAEHFKLGQVLYDSINKLCPVELPELRYNAGVKFLHERLHEI